MPVPAVLGSPAALGTGPGCVSARCSSHLSKRCCPGFLRPWQPRVSRPLSPGAVGGRDLCATGALCGRAAAGTRPGLRRASQRPAAALGLCRPLECRQRLSWGMEENISKEGKRLRSEAVDCAEVFPSCCVTVAVPSVPCPSYQVGSFSLLTPACPASTACLTSPEVSPA